MYPRFREIAIAEGQSAATVEIDEQIAESREHAEGFRDRLSAAQVDKAARKFAALTRIEQRHSAHYADRLAGLVCLPVVGRFVVFAPAPRRPNAAPAPQRSGAP